MMTSRWSAAAAMVLLASTGLVSARADASAATGAGGSARCGTISRSSARYQHVIWVWMENHSYHSVIGSPQAPYENHLARTCGLATNYHNISHPSLPNYIGATSGLGVSAVQKFASDCSPSTACSTSADSIFSQASSWRAYQESMPSKCSKHDSGEYAVRHNPPPYYTALTGCGKFDVPYPHLATDLARNTLPAFAFVTPNLIDDTHDGTVAQGDQWLKAHLAAIFDSAAYRSGTVVVFLTWDEGEGGTSNHCVANTSDIGCHVATIVLSPSTIRGTRSATLFSHYSLLRTTEQLLGLPPLRHAATAKSMRGPFNL